GEVIARIDTVGAAAPAPAKGGGAPTAAPAPAPAGAGATAAAAGAAKLEELSPATRRIVEENKVDPSGIPGTGRGGRLTKEDVQGYIASKGPGSQGNGEQPSAAPATAPPARHEAPAAVTTPPKTPAATGMTYDEHGERRAPMSKIRRRIAETLVKAQQTAAILTTFNEVDLQAVMDLRAKFKESFEKAHGVGLGFMSFFAKAVVQGLKDYPHVNAVIEGENFVYHHHVHLGIA